MVDAQEIDRYNILKASLMAMAEGLPDLAPSADHVLIDGSQTIPVEILNSRFAVVRRETEYKRLSSRATGVNCLSIAAASIVAKVARDQIMVDLDRHYPEYGFASHKGYGCAAHLEALQPSRSVPVHRRALNAGARAVIGRKAKGTL